MKTKESLSGSYSLISVLQRKYIRALTQYVNDSLEYCGGTAVLPIEFKTIAEAEDAEKDFYDQFPVSLTIEDKHGWNHCIYITKLYKENEIFYVDGYDGTDGEWIEGWFVDSSNDTLDSISCFLNEIISSSEEVEDKVADEKTDYVLVGYQLVDENNTYPCEFGCWDVFRTAEDAESYKKELLESGEWKIIEEFTDSEEKIKHYHFHVSKKRTFRQNERIFVMNQNNPRWVAVAERNAVLKWENDVLRINELNTGDEWIQSRVENRYIYKKEEKTKCPRCGMPAYSGHDGENMYCPECLLTFQ